VFGSDQVDDNIDPSFGGTSPEEYVVRGLPNGECETKQEGILVDTMTSIH
jgi:hypothetical protein